MLDRLKAGDIDYVIVHKVDRLARNRADDVEIVMAIRQAGAQLVSATENIDETPSGLLLHGIMSSIAEFYSRNLAAEVMKGTTQKAKGGGTPFRAPTGYLHDRATVDGREVRIVVLDSERAPLVKDAFKLYASGDYSLAELAAVMEERGLRSRATRKYPGRPLKAKDLHSMLRNSYYLGLVTYSGKTYAGRHEPLVDEATFEQVQDLLTSKRISGERPWRHFHHLRGSVYCGECDRRLIYSRANGHGGEYEYFICGGRQHGKCSQRSNRVEAVEAAVEKVYAGKELSDEQCQTVRRAIQAQVDALMLLAGEQVAEGETKLVQLERQERKLLNAHYADQLSETLFAEEQRRIRRERVTANKRIDSLSVDHDQAMRALDLALAMTSGVQQAYLRAKPQERRLLNQGLTKRFLIENEEVVEDQRTGLVGQLLDMGKSWGSDETAAKAKTPPLLQETGV